MKKLSILLVLVLVAGVAFVASAQGPTKQQELDAAGITNWTPGQNKGNGPTIAKLQNPIQLGGNNAAPETGQTETTQYDSGAVTALPTVFGQIFGNNFNADNAGNPYKTAVTLNSFSLLFAEDSTGDTGLFYQPADPGGATTIVPRASLNVGGLVNAGSSFTNTTAFNVVPQTALGTTGVFGSSFFLGAWCLNANATVPVDNEAIGLDTATFNGGFQGYTAVSGGGPTGVAFAAGSFNAILRANVTGVVPVELMAFEVE